MDTQQLLDLFTPPTKSSSTTSTTTTTASTTSSSIEAAESSLPKNKGLKSVLDELGELWDTTQYEEEYNVSSFLSNLKP